VAVLHQNYFIKDPSNKFCAEGTDWNIFKKKALSLSLGNEISINIKHGEVMKKVKIPPAKVICIEGSHIFSLQSEVNDIMNIRVFIDSDSDVRLSRRIYKDTV
jgi:uridine kinase